MFNNYESNIFLMTVKNFNDEHQIRGIKSEIYFRISANNSGWNVTKSTKLQDYSMHIDFIIDNNMGEKYTVDVKSMKKIARKDDDFQDVWIWIELRGACKSIGWLYGGKSDLIAFEQKDCYILVNCIDLINFISKKVDKKNIVNSPYKAHYKIYSRKNVFDSITLIHRNDLINMMKFRFDKPNTLLN